MPSYPKLKLVEHIPANLASLFFPMGEEEETEDPMLQMPFTLKITGENEAFIILVCDRDEDGFYGFTLLYYQKNASGWHRWLLERPDLPKEERWQKVDAPFEGIEAAIGYEARAARIRHSLNEEDLEAVVSGSPFNGDQVIPVGKYAGRTVRRVLDTGDFDYIRWVWDNRADLRDCFLSRTIEFTNKSKKDEDKAGAAE